MDDLPYRSSFEFVLIKARFSLYLLTITKLYLFYCKIFQFYIYFYMCCGQNMHNLTYLSWCHLDSQTLDMPIYDILSSKWGLTLFAHLLPLSIYGFIQSFVGHGDWKNEARFQAFKPLIIVFASNLAYSKVECTLPIFVLTLFHIPLNRMKKICRNIIRQSADWVF